MIRHEDNDLLGVCAWATFSPCMHYRYTLGRKIRERDDGGGKIVWLMLNPSTADAFKLDPTVKRCYERSKQWGYSEMVVVNLFAWRSTDPKGLFDTDDPIGPENDAAILEELKDANCVMAAWGKHKLAPQRAAELLAIIENPLCCLGVTKDGDPRHPLYIGYTQQRIAYRLFNARKDLPTIEGSCIMER